MSGEPVREGDATELVGSVLAGRYRVDRLLGEGGMGRVYLAEHVLMKKPVALKVLHPEMTMIPEIVGRFEREAVAAARIDHPNVAQAMDFARLPDGSLYFVLEYVDGRSLRSVLDAGPLGVDRALAIARQIASALVAAHDVGIVHRDLKPDNVMLVAQADGSDRVKVLDFGIAKLTAQDGEAAVPGKTLTRVGVVMGTVGYMAPEQALGQPVNHLADMYAFGSMLHEMLSGHLPFVAREITQLVAKQLTEAPPPLPASVPAELSTLTNALLARDQADRVQSAGELVETIERIIRTRALAAAATAFIADNATDAAELSGPIATSRTTGHTAAPRHRTWLVPGALLLLAVLAVTLLRLLRGESAAESVGPATFASAVTASASEQAPVAGSPSSTPPVAPVRGTEPAASALPSPEPHAETRRAESREENNVSRTKKTRRTRVTEEHTVKRTRRRTGPGGLYIPPPSEWFR